MKLTTEHQRKICRIIAKHYGIEAQTKQCIQELAELIVELSARPDQHNIKKLAEEIADSKIMLEQLIYFHDIASEVDEVIKQKLNRTILKIKEGKGNVGV